MLLGNYAIINRNCDTIEAGFTNPFGEFKPTAFPRFYLGDHVVTGETNKSNFNNGYDIDECGGFSWHLAPVAGGIGGRATGTGTLAATGAMGKNAEAALTGTGDLTASLSLIVSAVAGLTGSGTVAADGLGVGVMAGALTGTGTVAGTLSALGDLVAAITGTGTISGTATALGYMAADITNSAELAEQVAAAVWNAAVDDYNDTGSFGAAVNFVYALQHHKVVTDPVAGTFTVYDTDDTTPLYVADLWENTAGTLPYDGEGSERRDRFT